MRKLLLCLLLSVSAASIAHAEVLSLGLGERWHYESNLKFVKERELVAWGRIAIPAKGVRLAAEVERVCVREPNAVLRLGVEVGF